MNSFSIIPALQKYRYVLLFVMLSFTASAQQDLTSDELFQKARTAAFEHKDYPTSIGYAQQALNKSPEYTDIAIFLGRVYTWSDNPDAARVVFQELDRRNVHDEDFYLAYASLEYWNDQNTKALEILEDGLAQNPKSETLWLLKARVHQSTGAYADAEIAANSLLALNPENTEGRELLVRLNEYTSKNAVGLTYTFSHFDRQFEDDWHLVGISYKRVTDIGSVILRANYANKFGESGTQIELEAYPRLSKMFYLYLGAAYSNDVGIFPEYRTGASLNANLPRSFEAEIGYRQLYFTDHIWLYTAAVGKYYKNYWFNLRTYITPDSKNISHSYTGTVRYYTKGAQDYFALQAGTGISPEENRNNLLSDDAYKMKTYKIGAEYQFSVKQTNLFSVSAMYFNQEYRPNQKGNQFDVSVGYTKKF